MVTGSTLWIFLVFSFLRGCLVSGMSDIYLQMTDDAILEATFSACKSQATKTGKAFVPPSRPLTAESLVKACSSSESAISFKTAINEITKGSGGLDDRSKFSGFPHWRKTITDNIAAVKSSIKMNNFEAAREKLGEVLNALQNFYGHGDPIVLKNKLPFSTLIRLDVPFSDLTSWTTPRGTISKEGQTLATQVSTDLLQNVQAAVGSAEFLGLMSINQVTICFVIDTTGSMGDDIKIVRQITSAIINSKKGTPDEPSRYFLVPFNDPKFGPVSDTTNADEFQQKVNNLRADGGGDEPEMSLSALQLALTSTPHHSKIFVFTDASAKDSKLKSTDLALIEETKSEVNFLLTNALGVRRRRNTDWKQWSDEQERFEYERKRRSLSNPLNRDYEELAEASGGLAIEATKKTLPMATSIITDAASSAMVTLFQVARDSGTSERFSIHVDTTLSRLTIYITGSSLSFTVSSAMSVSQASSQTTGPLGTINKVGNFYTMHIKKDVKIKGLWVINVQAYQPYTVKVVGQSPIDFTYDFVEMTEGSDSFKFVNSRPPANTKATLLVAMTMPESVTVTEVAMVQQHSSTSAKSLKKTATGRYLATVDRVPDGGFTVQIKGMLLKGYEIFQRQSSTQQKGSDLKVTVQTTANMKPGVAFKIPFTVTSTHLRGTVTVRAKNDRTFKLSSPSSVTLSSTGRAEGTVTITAPATTPSGTDVTLTIEVEAPGRTDSNFAVTRLTVLAEVKDNSPPSCDVTDVNAECFGDCSLSTWKLSARLSDGKGSGIERIDVQQGNGTLKLTKDGADVTLATYSASCCSEEVKLEAVDVAGNVGTCSWILKKETFWHPYCS